MKDNEFQWRFLFVLSVDYCLFQFCECHIWMSLIVAFFSFPKEFNVFLPQLALCR